MAVDAAERRRVLVAVALGASLAPFMVSGLVVALPAIGREFGLSASDLAWVGTVFFLAAGAFLLPFGRLGDILGVRRLFTTGIGIFAVTAALSALAPSAPVLIASRIATGVGAAMVFGTSLAFVSLVSPAGGARPRHRDGRGDADGRVRRRHPGRRGPDRPRLVARALRPGGRDRRGRHVVRGPAGGGRVRALARPPVRRSRLGALGRRAPRPDGRALDPSGLVGASPRRGGSGRARALRPPRAAAGGAPARSRSSPAPLLRARQPGRARLLRGHLRAVACCSASTSRRSRATTPGRRRSCSSSPRSSWPSSRGRPAGPRTASTPASWPRRGP